MATDGCPGNPSDGLAFEPARALPGTTVVAAEGLTKSFDGTPAVAGLDLDVRAGEVFGLVGPDGAGKTTLLRLLCGVLSPDGGHAAVLGHDVVSQSEASKPFIGYMAQGFALYRDLTVDENLAFFSDAYSVPASLRATRVAALKDFAGLARFADRRAGHLSGGMQKKLALACSLVHAPSVLFLDEPTTGVDPIARREFWAILTGLHLQGATILVSTPYMDEAERCTRVGLMYGGRMDRCDTPEALRAQTPGEMLEVRADHPRAAASALRAVEGVLRVHVYGDRLHVIVDSAAAREPEVARALLAAGVGSSRVRQTRPRMEEAFIAMLEHRSGEAL